MSQARFDHSSRQETVKFIQDNIDRHKQFALATIDDEGNPWVVCLNLCVDEKFNVIWKSDKNTEHSKHIKTNPNVAICVFSETEGVGDFGFYSKAVAHEITDEAELERAIKLRFTDKGKPTPAKNEFLGDSTMRLYYAKLKQTWVNDDTHDKTGVIL